MALAIPTLTSQTEPQQVALGPFMFLWDGQRLEIARGASNRRVLWRSLVGAGFLQAGRGKATVHESRGFFTVDDGRVQWTENQTLDTLEATEDGVTLSGTLGGGPQASWRWNWRLADDNELHFDLVIEPQAEGPPLDRIHLMSARGADEAFFGFGEQLTHLNLSGKRIPVLSQEPGIGRGVQPLTWMMNLLAGAGGTDVSSNAPAPQFITSELRGFALTTSAYSVFDLRTPEQLSIELHQPTMHGVLFTGQTPLECIEAYTRTSGRMPAPPTWLDRGAIVGMQGGTQAVERMGEQLKTHDAPVAAYWLQDWVGARRTSIGEQLWWNWEVDPQRYPGWETLVERLEAEGAKVLTYLNPFLVDPREKGSFGRNLYQEALDGGYLVRNPDGTPYSILNTSFSASLVDLTNPEAWDWLKEVIKTQLLGAGASGWMADFGEALPFDAQLHDGRDAALYHNQYPEDWARLNREAVREAGREGEILFFTRSGYTRSPGQSTLFWMGDQLTAWDREDGIKSALVGLLSSGYAGISLNHGDIGGYTATTLPRSPLRIPFVSYTRGKELLLRWTELCAFTAVFRTHDGNQPDRNVQIDHDAETLNQFARFARLYAALAPYRRHLFEEAAERGYPVVRHLWLHAPEDTVARDNWDQLLLGPDLLLAPVLDPGQDRRQVYLPAGQWVHLWTGATHGDAARGTHEEIACPIGEPAAFYRADSDYAEIFVNAASEARG